MRDDRKKPGPGDAVGEEYHLDARTGALSKTLVVQQGQASLTGADLESASQGADQNGEPLVALKFTEAGAKRLAAVTGASVGRRLAVLVDGRVLSMPVIRESIQGGTLSLSGVSRPTRFATTRGPCRAGRCRSA
ncbi:MAG: hypothetical protein M0D55_15775 [Elusimicrobiota bacterium]|nr:MAG: hypothetical protein M0D55_15775 [Elusimicrobiota bacterium]